MAQEQPPNAFGVGMLRKTSTMGVVGGALGSEGMCFLYQYQFQSCWLGIN
jgi:hypothetical protein